MRSIPILATAILLTILLPSLSIAQDVARANEIMAEAGKALAQEDYATAAELFRELLDYYPLDAGVNYNLGLTLHKLGKYNEAIPYLEKTLEMEPNHTKAMSALGMVYYYLVDYPQARKYFQMYLQYQPGDAVIYGYLARMDYEDANYVSSADYYSQALSYTPDDSGMLYALAVCYQKNGDYELAARTFLQSAEAGYTTDIEAADPLYHWAYCLYEAGDWTTVASYAITSATSPLVAKIVGMAHTQLGDYTSAITAFKQALNNGQSEVYPLLAQSYIKLEDYTNAVSILKKAIDNDPGNISLYSNLAYVLNKLDKYSEAISTCRSGLALAEGDEGLLRYFLGVSLINSGDTNGGKAELEKFLTTADEQRYPSQVEHAKLVVEGQ